MEIREVNVKRILNPTAIDLGDYVINPYRGCALSCAYCYVRCNKVVRNDPRQWGTYVDVRINAPQLLAKELTRKKPGRVLLGSTTECFQPLEARYHLTREILEILTSHNIPYTILTRSPLILDYLPLLKRGPCASIYFTVNCYAERLKRILEPHSPSFRDRMEAVKRLAHERLPVVAYISPLLPYLSDIPTIFSRLDAAERIECEGLNFNLGNFNTVVAGIRSVNPQIAAWYCRMLRDKNFYETVWQHIKKEVVAQAIKKKKNHSLYIHKVHAYFENSYVQK
jgi:DNA repair photolyase